MTTRLGARVGGVLVLASMLAAQVPDGSFVISSFQLSAATSLGGLFIVHPRIPGAPVAITGLGPDLTGNNTGRAGANCVTIHPDTGVLLVGEIGSFTSIELHQVFLAGSTAVFDIPITVGTASLDGGINQIAVLPGGADVLIGVIGLAATPPLNGACLAVVNLASGIVTPVPGGPTNSYANAVAVDRTGTLGYYAFGGGAIYEIPVPGGGVPRLIATVQGTASLAVDYRGQIISTYAGPVPGIVTIDPVLNTASQLFVVGVNPNAMMIERATDGIIYALNGLGTPGPQVHWITRTGVDTPLATVTGVPSGVDVCPDPLAYGTPSGAAQCTWTTTPHPLALPFAGVTGGNWRFAVDWNSTAPVFSATFFALAPSATLPLPLGIDAWIDLGSLLGSVPMVLNPALNQSEATIALPPLLTGTLYLQEVHLDAGLLFGASNPLRATIL
jgi:hypothetical protein